MSEENVEIARRGFEVWNAGDMDALRELYDPRPGRLARAGAVRGSGGGHAPGGATARDLDSDSFELISDFIDVGDRVAVRFIWRTAGHGPESNIEATGIWTVRKGRMVAIEFFWDHAEVLEILGVSE